MIEDSINRIDALTLNTSDASTGSTRSALICSESKESPNTDRLSTDLVIPSVNDGLSSGSEHASASESQSPIQNNPKKPIVVNVTCENAEENSENHSETSFVNEESSDNERTIDNNKLNKPLRDCDYESDQDTDNLLNKSYQEEKKIDIPELKIEAEVQFQDDQHKMRIGREVAVRHPSDDANPIPGVLFRTNYLGSTQFMCPAINTKSSRMIQAQEALDRVKAPEGESQPLCPVELFVSAFRLLIMNVNLKEIIIDHILRNISYIADIGDILVIMARREDSPTHNDDSHPSEANQQSQNTKFMRIICHVFKSQETKTIAQCIGRAFQISYSNFLRENGIDESAILEQQNKNQIETSIDSQEFFCDEINMFCDKEKHKEIMISKGRNEPLGVVIVESGWGSLLPCIVIGNMLPTGSAARCGQLNIGNQILEINGQSTVGLTFNENQNLIKKCKNLSTVKLLVVDSTPVTEVMIRRPDIRHQLGFSVQNGVVCSLLRGGIAERGGLRIDHRIIEINGESVSATRHETIIQMLAVAVGEIHLRTMPAVIFRLLTGQETPIFI